MVVGAGRTGEGERGRAHAITRSWTLTHPPHTPDGLPHHVLKTALWGDWKQLVSVWLCVCVVFEWCFSAFPHPVFPTPPLPQPPEGVPTPELRWTLLASVLAAAGAPDARGGASYAVAATVAGVVGSGGGGGNAVSSSVSSVTLPLTDASLAGRTIDALLPARLAASPERVGGWCCSSAHPEAGPGARVAQGGGGRRRSGRRVWVVSCRRRRPPLA